MFAATPPPPKTPEPEPEPEPVEQLDPGVQVAAWRLLCLLDAGYELEVAQILAAPLTDGSYADLHEMCEAREHGCSSQLALLIFA